MMPLKYEKKSPVGRKHWKALTFITSDIIPLITHQQEGIIKEGFHTWTLQWPPLYCGSLASKTPCKMRWCLWNMRRSLLLGWSIEWLWLLSCQILFHWGHINKKASLRRHFTLELYNGLHSTVVHWHLRLLVRCDDAFEIWEEVSCWEEALKGFDFYHVRYYC